MLNEKSSMLLMNHCGGQSFHVRPIRRPIDKYGYVWAIVCPTLEEDHFVHRSLGAPSGYASSSFLPFVAKHISCMFYCLSFATLSSIFNAEVQWLIVLRIHHCGGN